MNNAAAWLRGYLRVKVVGASPQWCLNVLTKEKVPFWGTTFPDEFASEFFVFAKDWNRVNQCALRAMCDCTLLDKCGFCYLFAGLRKRFGFVVLLAVVLMLTVFLPQRIWFFEVEGNRTVPAEKILRTAQQCGVHFGVKGKSVVPQQVKDHVLAQIPELAWLTVRQNGMRATVVVREKQEPEPVAERRRPRNMIAVRDGMVEEISVLDGSAAVQVGDVVKEGELLISGFVDLEYAVRATAAHGEVYAQTRHEKQTVVPASYTKKTKAEKKYEKFYLQLGKRRIKLSSGSGIFTVGCDKMTESKILSLPQGLHLPVVLVKETYIRYETKPADLSQWEAEALFLTHAKEETQREMVAGEILNVSQAVKKENGRYVSRCVLECREMIGRYREAEIFKKD